MPRLALCGVSSFQFHYRGLPKRPEKRKASDTKPINPPRINICAAALSRLGAARLTQNTIASSENRVLNRSMHFIMRKSLRLIGMAVRHPVAVPCSINPALPMRAELSVCPVMHRGVRKPPYQFFQSRLDSPGIPRGKNVAQGACACTDAAVPEMYGRTLQSVR